MFPETWGKGYGRAFRRTREGESNIRPQATSVISSSIKGSRPSGICEGGEERALQKSETKGRQSSLEAVARLREGD